MPSKDKPSITSEATEILNCGIVMPIASMGAEYPESHWKDVRRIIDQAIIRAGYSPRIVSDAKESTVIHQSIVNNIYSDPIIVCDVSGKNPNVMFELGMRLAFDKPVVIIKDDITGYSFDTSNIQHLGYRKDLRHGSIESFIEQLAQKIKATYEVSLTNDYSTFLSQFGSFKISKIEDKSIFGVEAIEKLLNQMENLNKKINSFTNYDNSISSDLLISREFNVMKGNNFDEILNEIKTSLGDYIKLKLVRLKPDHPYDLKYMVNIYIDGIYPDEFVMDLKRQANKLFEMVDELPF